MFVCEKLGHGFAVNARTSKLYNLLRKWNKCTGDEDTLTELTTNISNVDKFSVYSSEHLHWFWFKYGIGRSSFFFILVYYLLAHVRLIFQFLWDRQTKFLVFQPSLYLNDCLSAHKSPSEIYRTLGTSISLTLVLVKRSIQNIWSFTIR